MEEERNIKKSPEAGGDENDSQNEEVTPPPTTSTSATSGGAAPSDHNDLLAAMVTTSTTTTPTVLSKKQRKRLLKQAKVQEKKRQRKEDKRTKAIAAGRDLEAERQIQARNTASGHRTRRLRELWQTEKLPLAEESFRICVDCSFESLMDPREIASLAQQLRYCYAYNKNSPNPSLVAATSLGASRSSSSSSCKDGDVRGATLEHLHKEIGFSEWRHRLFTCTSQSLEEYYLPEERAKHMVYLTSDSETVIDELDSSKIYVIGGIVDRNRLKRVAMDRAEILGVATAKLPLDAHLAGMASTPVLTCNHVFDILLKYRQYGNHWGKALQDVLPSRKEAHFALTTADSDEEKKQNNTAATDDHDTDEENEKESITNS